MTTIQSITGYQSLQILQEHHGIVKNIDRQPKGSIVDLESKATSSSDQITTVDIVSIRSDLRITPASKQEETQTGDDHRDSDFNRNIKKRVKRIGREVRQGLKTIARELGLDREDRREVRKLGREFSRIRRKAPLK